MVKVQIYKSSQVCGYTFSSAKGRDQHIRIKHKMRISVYDHVPVSSACRLCGTQFGNRLSLVAHLADRRVRSRVKGFSCGTLFHANLPPPLDQAILAELREEDKLARKKDLNKGHTHALVTKLASKAKASPLKGIAAKRLGLAKLHGCRRRLSGKTPALVANLRFQPRKRYRLAAKSKPRCFLLPSAMRCSSTPHLPVRKRIFSKTSIQELASKGIVA